MSGRVWTGRSLVLAGATVLVGCLTVYLLAAGSRGDEIASVLSLTCALLLAVFTWLARSHDLSNDALAAAARSLAARVRQEWADTLQRLLADGGASDPADVSFVRRAQAGLVRWRSDGGTDTGSLADIAAYYAQLRRGRLVVLGAPGSGKTVLAVYLLLKRLDAVLTADPAPAQLRVPVLLSLPAWPTPSTDVADRKLSAHFDNWIARHLAQTYRLPRPVADALVTRGWVLPVLDGMDEMDAEGSADAGGGLPPPATLLVRALNQDPGTGLRPIVLTCREHRYRQLLLAGGEPGAPPVLADATAVTMQPLTAAQVNSYLAYRFPDPTTRGEPAGLDTRWQPVATALAADPGGPLAAALGTPWRLFLAVNAYYANDTRPADLVDLAQTHPGDLDEHLLGRLIPAATRLHRRPDGTRYQPDEITRGLATLARHLAGQQARGGSGTDVRINELWRTAGPRAPRYLHAALAAIPAVCGLALSAVVTTAVGTFGSLFAYPLYTPYERLAYISAILAVLFVMCSAALARSSSNRRMNYRRLGRLGMTEIRTLAYRLPVGLAYAFPVALASELPTITEWVRWGGLVSWLVIVLADWLAFGLIFGFVLGLAGIAQESPRAVDRPSALLREDLAFRLTLGLMGGLAFWIAELFTQGLAYLLALGLVPELVTAGFSVELPEGYGTMIAMFGLGFGLTFGLARSIWPRFAVAGAILARHGTMPKSLRSFLDWAYSAGLLRLSGTSLQFRHIEFQRWVERQP